MHQSTHMRGMTIVKDVRCSRSVHAHVPSQNVIPVSLQIYRNAAKLLIFLLRVLPCLRQHAVVPVDVVGVKAQLVLLNVLLQRV